MKVNILAGGSGGNCIAVQSNETTILVDAGIAKTKIEKALLEVDIKPTDINAILITHAHGDHVKGLPLANKYRIPVYAGAEEWKDIKSVDEELRNELEANQYHYIHSYTVVTPFKTHHDAYEPLGYTIENDVGEKVSVCLDTGKVDSYMLEAMKDSDIYIIEANHDPKILESNDKYPTSTKARILSDIGHLSNEQCAEALRKLVRGVGEKVYLTHLSDGNKEGNNFPWLAKAVVESELSKKGFKEGQHYHLEVVE